MDRGAEPADDVWVHPCVEVRSSPVAGDGLFVTTRLDAGVVVIRLGGRLVNSEELHRLFADAADDEYIDTFAVDDDTHIVLPTGTSAHDGNHSCEPNLWPISTYEIATRRPVNSGDELTVDYGTTCDDATYQMVCTCGASSCRTVITGEDWRRADVQQRYAGHWPLGLQRRIDNCTRQSDENDDPRVATKRSARVSRMTTNGGPPDGYHTLTTRVVVADVAAQVAFLKATFDAEGDVVVGRPVELRIGDSLLMIAEARERELFPGFLYVYVADADAAYERAVHAGASTIEAPLDTPYGDRRAMVRDPFGNVFQIAHRLV